jgi:hypothetical protein
MNNEIRSKSVHNNPKMSTSKFSKRIKPLETIIKKRNLNNLNSIEKKLLSNKN